MNIKKFLQELEEDQSIELFDRFKTKTLKNTGWVKSGNLSEVIANIIGDKSMNKGSSHQISQKILERAKEANQVEDLTSQDLYIDTSNLASGTILVHIYNEQGKKVDTMTLGRSGKDMDVRWSVVS